MIKYMYSAWHIVNTLKKLQLAALIIVLMILKSFHSSVYLLPGLGLVVRSSV